MTDANQVVDRYFLLYYRYNFFLGFFRKYNILRHLFLQKQPRRPHGCVGMETLLHDVSIEAVVDRHKAHSLMMRHKTSYDGIPAVYQPFRCIVHRFIKAVIAFQAVRFKTSDVFHRTFRVDHQRKERGIWRSDRILEQPSFETKPWHANGLV